MKYDIVHSSRKTMAIEVARDGRVVVRAPYGVGRTEITQFVQDHQPWITQATARQAARVSAYPEPTEEKIRELQALAKGILPEKVAYYARILGVWPEAITITSARTRFGSCSSRNRISFSWRLMQYPEEAIDYVVVHELCHMIHHNHSKAFYNCVAKILPDWPERRVKLKT